ncbi:MAG: type III pantothenate kinase [Lachnospiraceae bacterium]|nr:type III pantothenate kinase [Lachnospiraceae bacterium]
MILAIDIGNTNLVIGCIEGEQICFEERLSTNISKTELEYVVDFITILNLHQIEKESITGCIVASVVPPLNTVVKSAIEKLLHISPIFVGPGVKTGLNIAIDNPASVGADLIVNAVAGLKEYGAPLVMIDMGTATTITVLDEKKNYIGGIIMPGLKVSLEALVNGTSQLPRISLEAPKKVIARNTVDSMKSGMVIGQAAEMDGLIDRIWEELGMETPVVASGGLAGFIVPHCRKKIILDNELTMKGLGYIYRKNVEE